MKNKNLSKMEALARERAQQEGIRYHVVRFISRLIPACPMVAFGVVAEGAPPPEGAVRVYSTPAGPRKRRAYR